MDSKIGIIIGMATVCIALGVLCLFIFRKVSRTAPCKADSFDERQQIVRGQSFRAAYITLIFLLIAYSIAGSAFGFTGILSPLYGISISMLLSLLPMLGIRIFKDSYLGRNNRLKPSLISVGLISIANLLQGMRSTLFTGELLTSGDVDVYFLSFLVGIIGLIVIIMVLIRNCMLKKAEKAEDEE